MWSAVGDRKSWTQRLLPCAARLRGTEYPLREPCTQPLYITGRAAAEALGLFDE
jgi:hypothetical protein